MYSYGRLNILICELFYVYTIEYIKVQHLYSILIPSACVLLSFCVRIGAFDRFSRFCACVGFSSFVHIFVGVHV